jgi:fatty acid desaturase
MDADFVPKDFDRRVLSALLKRSDRAGFLRGFGHFGTLAGTGALVLLTNGSLLLVPAMALHGAVLVFLFAPLHETIHRTAFRKRRLNDAVAFVCGLPLLLPPEYFRAFHFAHHRYTQDPAQDPELAGGGRPATRGALLLHLTGLPYWAFQARLLVRHAWGRVDAPFLSAAAGQRVIREAHVVVAIYAGIAALSLAFGSPLALLLWVGPALLGQPWLRAFLAAEHMLCPFVPEMARNTRTTLTSRLILYYGWNMSFHAEHHLNPAIPFHGLPAAHQSLQPKLAIVGNGYLTVLRQIWAASRTIRQPG